MYSILLDVWHHIEALKPAFISKTPHFNFITVHYFWIIGNAILGSLFLFIRGGIPYIDALFLASGAATQSGLNTININDLNTWQQLATYFTAMVCNPITINTFVVFLRLYWFEKRFQHIAREAKSSRRSIAKTFSKSKTDEGDHDREERGVQGRSIVVMHNAPKPNSMANDGSLPNNLTRQMEKMKGMSEEEQARSSGETSKNHSSDSGEDIAERNGISHQPSHQPSIKFADQVRRSNGLPDELLHLPAAQRSQEEHIAILERQRNPEDRAVLRIPGPRDADAGVIPEEVDEADTALSQIMSRRDSNVGSRRGSGEVGNLNGDDHTEEGPSRNTRITIEEPTRHLSPGEHIAEDAVAMKHTIGGLKFRRPRMLQGKSDHNEKDDEDHNRSNTFNSIKKALSRDKEDGIPYLSWEPTVGRNSAFVDLTESQREELGGIEYRSLKSLATILVVYFVGFSVFGVVCLTPWILHDNTYGSIVEQDGQGRAWWGIYTANSAFTDLGYTLTPDSMISFQTAVWPLLLMTFLIIIGNTGFPIMLRIIIWLTSQYVPRASSIFEELKFLLDHPRRCFTLLFPAKATWWLFWILVILNGLDLLFFIVLDLGNTVVTQLPVHIRVLDGWFQAVSTRTAGFGVVNLSLLHPAIQVSYLIMMYISVLPIAISVRRTNVYEEKSLGIYGSPSEENEDEGEPSYVGAHLRRQLSFDLWYIFLGFFVIAIAEGTRLQTDPNFTMFSVLFEIVSAYGTVGLSLGYTGIDASLSAEFTVISKLVIIAMQVRGRHRGLPYELDRAILLPSEHLQEKEETDASQRARRRSSIETQRTANMSPYPGVSSGAMKTRTRTRSTQRGAANFLGTLLHPGPTIPNSHRNPQFDGNFERSRRHSIAIPPTHSGYDRSVSPNTSATRLDSVTEDRGREGLPRTEGRRRFYQDGVNPLPDITN